jgi:ABC-2 type transport system ATP-binding protein
VNAVEVEALTRSFHNVCALDNLSFSVGEGEVFGCLGPNGAGKTTAIRILTGQLRPTSGRVCVLGCELPRDRQRLQPQIGVVFEYQNLYERMSGWANLAFSARLYGVDERRVGEVLEQVGLGERGRDPVKHYSNGMKQRLLVARALLHRPRLLFLDEPTRGLDPTVAQEIRALIAEMASQGVTIVLTTHYMEEADQLCGRVAFLNEGCTVALDTPERLKIAYGQRSVQARLIDGTIVHLSLEEPGDGLRLGELAASGQILTLRSSEATLEQVFIQLAGRGLVE